MRLFQIAAILLALGACSDETTSPPPGDGPPGSDASLTPDGPPSNACTGKSYDPCTMNTQCMSNDCHLYAGQGLQVCVPTCTPGNNSTCPVDKTGANGFCNNMGICRPAAANDCTR